MKHLYLLAVVFLLTACAPVAVTPENQEGEEKVVDVVIKDGEATVKEVLVLDDEVVVAEETIEEEDDEEREEDGVEDIDEVDMELEILIDELESMSEGMEEVEAMVDKIEDMVDQDPEGAMAMAQEVMLMLADKDTETAQAYGAEVEVAMEESQEMEAEMDKMDEEAKTEMTVFGEGAFNEIDFLHKASGTVKAIDMGDTVVLEFSEDFTTTNGPDLFVHLSSEQEYKERALFGADTSKSVNLGVLASKEGKQYYTVSKDVWEQHNHSVFIWCRAFRVLFSRAILE